MTWLKIFVVYYILLYLLGGRILVELLEVMTWDTMIGIFVGCCLGHYLGKIDAGWVPVGKSRKGR